MSAFPERGPDWDSPRRPLWTSMCAGPTQSAVQAPHRLCRPHTGCAGPTQNAVQAPHRLCRPHTKRCAGPTQAVQAPHKTLCRPHTKRLALSRSVEWAPEWRCGACMDQRGGEGSMCGSECGVMNACAYLCVWMKGGGAGRFKGQAPMNTYPSTPAGNRASTPAGAHSISPCWHQSVAVC
eukprot:364390-Chlamydomonas_euryale.AAC.4